MIFSHGRVRARGRTDTRTACSGLLTDCAAWRALLLRPVLRLAGRCALAGSMCSASAPRAPGVSPTSLYEAASSPHRSLGPNHPRPPTCTDTTKKHINKTNTFAHAKHTCSLTQPGMRCDGFGQTGPPPQRRRRRRGHRLALDSESSTAMPSMPFI